MQTLEITPNANQKAGNLTGGAVTAEVLDSSRHILSRARGGNTKGLNQYYTAPALAAFVKDVLDPAGRFHVLDLTAGDGSLLAPYAEERRVGVEIDADQIKAAKAEGRAYKGLFGDVQKLFPLMDLAGLRFSRLALNPPFGLDDWAVKGQKMNSARATLHMALTLLATGGQGALIMGAARADRDILTDPALSKAVYAVLDLPKNCFPGVTLPTCVLFFADPAQRRSTSHGAERVPFSEDSAHTVERARLKAFTFLDRYDSVDGDSLPAELRKIQSEHTRRRDQQSGKAAQDIATAATGKLSVRLSDIAAAAVIRERDRDALRNLRALDGSTLNYFATNPRNWHDCLALADAGIVTLDSRTRAKVKGIMDKAQALACPVYPVKPQQRLGYLTDAGRIRCIQADPKNGFEAGEWYAVDTRSRINTSERKEVKEVPSAAGGVELKELVWVREAKVLDILLTSPAKVLTLSEDKKDIEYLLAHFDLPDPGDLATRFPQEMNAARAVIDAIQADHLTPRGVTLKGYQREDVCRLMLKSGGVLSWEQGLGKTLGAMLFAQAQQANGETDGNVLFVTPQDLIPQWQAEAKKFFGRELVWIKTRHQSRQIAEAIRAEHAEAKGDPWHPMQDGEGGKWYVTHFEALSLGGTSGKVILPVGPEGERVPVRTSAGRVALPIARVRTITKKKLIPGGYREGRWQEAETVTQQIVQTTEVLCPRCWDQSKQTTHAQNGWNGSRCEACGYSHAALNLKSVAHELTTAFKEGCVIVDEATKIKGDDSLQGLAVRGLRARRKLLLTGTPVKNKLLDIFHLLGWALGYDSPRFPFAYAGGKDKFKDDFCVVEYLPGKGREKILPDITNVSLLWKLLSGSIVRRRKEDSGEPLVARTFRPVTVPFGAAQKEQYQNWLDGFPAYYCAKNPEANADMVELNAAILGQLHKLNYASTMPTADPDAGYFGIGVSDWTPKFLKATELCAFHAARGEQVLFVSDVKLLGRAVADALNGKDIPAEHILEETKSGAASTKSPAARAGAVLAFREGRTRVLCAGMQTISLGHNLDNASVIVVDGLCWDFATFDQVLARVHRLTSKRDVTIYVVMTAGSLDERKWDALQKKTAASGLALDGELHNRDQDEINLQAVLKEMREAGVPDGPTIPEAECRRIWEGKTYDLLPVGSEIVEEKEEAQEAPQKAAQTALDLGDGFTFQTVKPKKGKDAQAATIAQGCLFAL